MSQAAYEPDWVGLWKIVLLGDTYGPVDFLQRGRQGSALEHQAVPVLAYTLVAWLFQWVGLCWFEGTIRHRHLWLGTRYTDGGR